MRRVYISFLVLVIFVLGACGEKKEELDIRLSTIEFSKKLTNKDSFVLYLNTSDCYTCDLFIENLSIVQQETPFKIYHVLFHKEKEDDQLKLEKTLGRPTMFPTTYYIKDGKVEEIFDDVSIVELEVFKEWLLNIGSIN